MGGLKGSDFAIARFTSAGAPDSTFGGSSGYTATDFASGTDAASYAIARQADGKFVAAGLTSGNGGQSLGWVYVAHRCWLAEPKIGR